MEFTGFVFAWIGRADERVRPRLDGVGEFLEVFGDVAEIIEEFVDIFGVDVERLIQVRGQVSHIGESVAKLGDRFANIGAIFADEGIDVIDGFVRFRGGCAEILQERLELFADGIDVLKSGV